MEEERKEKTRTREKTNEEYRIELQRIFENITDNRKLRFYYLYVSGLEKDD